MNKTELIAAVSTQTELNRQESAAAVNAVVEQIASAVARGDRVAVPGLGVFETRARSAREGRNPHTGEPIKIAATVVPAFRPAAELKRRVAEARTAG